MPYPPLYCSVWSRRRSAGRALCSLPATTPFGPTAKAARLASRSTMSGSNLRKAASTWPSVAEAGCVRRFPFASRVPTLANSRREHSAQSLAAHGYSVVTPEVTIVDLGTSFRVNVGDEGRMSCHVTDGRVKLDRRGTTQPIKLSAGNVARLADPDDEIAILERSLLDATANIQFVAEHRPSLGYNAYDRDDEISVFLETQSLRLSEEIRVNMNQAGRHDHVNSVRGKIATGTSVDCYLVHCAPQRKRHIVEGQITSSRANYWSHLRLRSAQFHQQGPWSELDAEMSA